MVFSMFFMTSRCISLHSAAVFMTHHYDELAMQMFNSILNASKFIVSNDMARRTDGKNIAQSLVKNNLGRYPGIRATDYGYKRMLSFFELPDPVECFVRMQRMLADKPFISCF